ncbi:ParB/RepB/Spo0J family partition protein [Chengkuizengella axinellae]|uniref:ParB/RepB/Spo0J family partition protein n=1 Tax=Chengkuizengella axinellae TaxID=3064388 RepID=A0ABT9J383_9BACL|nr:ParB/RepB/Spo0J family partition protein [Chengkuizengella sp. 2205SS18-9]MDP5276071.1 ParB/RepB/Spo0J family partition protein [Chengkuizengella sp. 2205SS18-9]
MTKRLGRGLDALIPALDVKEDDKVIQIGLTNLRPNPYQPRKNFQDDKIDELAASIKEHGVIQPIIVRQVLKGYEIIAGERRWRASKKSGLKTIPAVVRSFSDQQVTEIALIENLQREDLNPMEVAVAYQTLIDQFQLTQEELSVKVGKSRSHIANFLRLIQLPSEIKQYVSRGTISMGHARAIVGLKDNDLKKEMTNLTIKNEWSVRELEKAIQNSQEIQPKKKKSKKTNNPFIIQVEDELRNKYKTTVKIKNNQNDKGIIELSYFSKDDLQRLLDLL